MDHLAIAATSKAGTGLKKFFWIPSSRPTTQARTGAAPVEAKPTERLVLPPPSKRASPWAGQLNIHHAPTLALQILRQFSKILACCRLTTQIACGQFRAAPVPLVPGSAALESAPILLRDA